MLNEVNKDVLETKKELRVKEVAVLKNVATQTVRKWIMMQNGLRTVPYKEPVMILRDDLEYFLKNRKTTGRPKKNRR